MRKIRIIVFTVLGVALLAGVPLIALNPGIQTRIYIHETARNPRSFLARATRRFVGRYEGSENNDKTMPASMLNALAAMLSDRDPLVRDRACFFMWPLADENLTRFAAIPGAQETLKRLVADPDRMISGFGVRTLGDIQNDDNLPFLRGCLKRYASNEDRCQSVISALACSKDPLLLDEVLPFGNDSRQNVSWMALGVCAAHDDPRVLNAIAEQLRLPGGCHAALDALDTFQKKFPMHDISAQMDPALLEASMSSAVPRLIREGCPPLIKDVQMQIHAWENLLLNPSTDAPVECQLDTLRALDQMKPAPVTAVPTLEKIINDPATDAKVRAKAESLLKKIWP